MSLHYVTLLLGSNLGDTEKNIKDAIAKIENRIGKIKFCSKIIETIPVEFVSKNNFRNIALGLHVPISPFCLLKEIKIIENDMGRAQDSFAVGEYVDRIIDIDIITFDNINYKSKHLEIPHKKHLFEREFSKKLLEDINEKIKTQI